MGVPAAQGHPEAAWVAPNPVQRLLLGMRARSKKQALESNVPEIDELRCSCHHTHSRSEWTPYRTTDGTWHYPSTGEAKYMADLAFAIAVALSWWAVRTGSAKLHGPRAPVVQDTGNRNGWADMPPQVMRSWVVAAAAIRLGLRPPATRPGQWFPEEDKAKVTYWRKHVTAKNPAGDTVYVGQTEGCSRSPRTNVHPHSCQVSTVLRPSASPSTCCGSAPRRN